jgi:hypothetical protein
LRITVVTFLTKQCGLLQCFPTWFFFYDFVQNFICQFYFFNMELVENLVLNFFSLKHCRLLQCSPTWVFLLLLFLCFFMIFPQNYICRFYFLILSWLRIIITIYGKSNVAFFINYRGLLQCFPRMFFFNAFFLKLSLSILFF